MPRALTGFLALGTLAASAAAGAQTLLHAQRASAGDLAIGGELKSVPAGETRYLRYADLLKLPQETYTVSDDSNLPRGTVIGGVALLTLARLWAQAPGETLMVAICDDGYRAHYPRAYVAAHHPLLVLRVNGKLRGAWPPAEGGGSLGPYLISHPFFHPAFRILAHEDEPQIPYGVVRLEFRREALVFGAIRPPGRWSANSPVEQGYAIARQDCFRCHNSGAEGGQKAGKDWRQLATMARGDPERFRAIIRDPARVTPGAKMPGEPNYDEATLDALTAYFRTFAGSPGAAGTGGDAPGGAGKESQE
jgi:mono/diheme cytochrome c family protein